MDLMLALSYAWVCFLFGLTLLRLLKIQGPGSTAIGSLSMVGTSFLLGQGVLGTLCLLLGVVRQFNPYSLLLVLGVMLVAGLVSVRKSMSILQRLLTDFIAQTRGIHLIWKVIFFMVAFLTLSWGLRSVVYPPLGDAEAFYMVLPKIVAASHRLVPQPNYFDFTQVGLAGEMHYAALISLASPFAAKLFTWLTSLALAAMLISICSEVGCSVLGKLVALGLLVTSTTFTFYIFDGKVDIYGGALGLGAYFWSLHAGRMSGRIPYVLAGIFTGLACVAKFSNIPVIVPGVILLIIWNPFLSGKGVDISLKQFVLSFCLFCMCTALALFPHFIKNFALFGEPFAPFLFLFGNGERWTEQVWFSPETTKYILMTYPLALAFGKYPMQGGNLSPLILAFAPISIFMRNFAPDNRMRLRQVFAAALIGIAIWMLVQPTIIAPRYILATLLLFIPLAAKGIEELFSDSNRFRILKGFVIAAMLLMIGVEVITHSTKALFFIEKLGRISLQGWRDYPPTQPFQVLNTAANPGDRVFIGGYYTYFMRPDLLQCLSSQAESNEISQLISAHKDNGEYHKPDRPGLEGSTITYADLFYIFMHEKGFSYIMIQKDTHRTTSDFMTSEPPPSWVVRNKLFEDKSTDIYKLSYLKGLPHPSYTCTQMDPPAWDVVRTIP